MAELLTKALRIYRDSYAGMPRQVWTLTLLTLINRAGTMVIPFLTVYLTTVRQLSLKQAGLIASAFGLGSLCGAYLGGRFSDRWGARWVLMISLAVGGLLFISLQWATTPLLLFLGVFAAALFGESYRPAVSVLVSQFVAPHELGRATALLRLAINLGMSAAPAVGGFVAALMGYRWLFWIDGVTCCLAAAFFWVASRNWQHGGSKPIRTHETVAPVHACPPWRNRSYLWFLLATFVMGVGFVQWFHSVPVFIKSQWGFDERYIGTLMAVSSLLIALIELPVVHFIEKVNRIRASVHVGLILMGLSFLPLLLPAAWAIGFLAMLLFTMGEILLLPFNNAIALNMSPLSRRGEYMAWYWMAWSLTNIAGPLCGLVLLDEIGFVPFWIGLSLLVGLSLLINLATQRYDGHESKTRPVD